MGYSATSPLAAGQDGAVGTGDGQTTQPTNTAAARPIDTPAVSSGLATKYWIELVAYPAGSARSLWLHVNNAWKRLDNPSPSIQDAVQRTFIGTGSNVRVWFDDVIIVGLVVEGS